MDRFFLKSFFVFNLFLLWSFPITQAADVALTPPMGWLSWESFKCTIECNKQKDNCISENLFKQIAETIINEGYQEAGYININIDDCWMSESRSFFGDLKADETRFPKGMKFLADYMHSRGLKLGIYQNIGVKTCMGFPGSRNYYKQDAEAFASWDIDMVKMDGCNEPPKNLAKSYKEFGRYLNRSKRPIVYSCSWPYYEIFYSKSKVTPNFKDVAETCNLWRVYHDIVPDWKFIIRLIEFFGDHQYIILKYVKPGHWADPDMLLVGNPQLNVNQARAHMGMWAILAAPLLISVDLRNVEQKYKEILLNKDVIAINQHKAGIPGERIFTNGSMDVWLRRLPNNEYVNHPSFAFGFLNKRGGPCEMSLDLKFLKLNGSYRFFDVFNRHFKILEPEETLNSFVNSESLTLYRADPIFIRNPVTL